LGERLRFDGARRSAGRRTFAFEVGSAVRAMGRPSTAGWGPTRPTDKATRGAPNTSPPSLIGAKLEPPACCGCNFSARLDAQACDARRPWRPLDGVTVAPSAVRAVQSEPPKSRLRHRRSSCR